MKPPRVPPWFPPSPPSRSPSEREKSDRRPTRPRSFWAKDKDIQKSVEDTRRLLSMWSQTSDQTLRPVFDLIHARLFDSSFNATEATQAMARAGDRLQFTKATGGDVRTYIENGRLLLASLLLAVPDIEMYLIADAVGYDHYATFSRAFLRRFGCSPSEYRSFILSSGTDAP